MSKNEIEECDKLFSEKVDKGMKFNYSYIQKIALDFRRVCKIAKRNYEGWNFNSGNYLFTTDTK